jgi:hypothetical protein
MFLLLSYRDYKAVSTLIPLGIIRNLQIETYVMAKPVLCKIVLVFKLQCVQIMLDMGSECFYCLVIGTTKLFPPWLLWESSGTFKIG